MIFTGIYSFLQERHLIRIKRKPSVKWAGPEVKGGVVLEGDGQVEEG